MIVSIPQNKNLFLATGALGHSELVDIDKPKLIKTLSDKKVVDISSGWHFCTALTETFDLYCWGRGEYGALGMDSSHSQIMPTLNNIFEEYQDMHGIKPAQIKSVRNHSMVLMGKIVSGKI